MKKSPFSRLGRMATAAAGLVLASGLAFGQTQVPADLNFPDTPSRVITLDDGSELNVYEARVVRSRGSQLTVRFGDDPEQFRYSVPADFRFNIDGRRVGVRELGEGDTLNVYVKHQPGSESMFYEYDESAGTGAAAVGATTAAVAAPPPAQSEPMQTAMLPSTASPLPLIGMLGALFVSLGGLGFAVRRRLS